MKKNIQILIHIGLWAILWALPLFAVLVGSPEITNEWKIHILYANTFTLLGFYFSYWYVAPRILDLKKWYLQVLHFLGAAIIFLLIKFSGYWILDPILENLLTQAQLLSWPKLLADGLNSVLVMAIAILIRFTINLNKKHHKQADMQVQQHRNELALLKAQINPHFFFNTINNIYSLVYKKSDDAPAALLKLSEIMRYMLYDSKTDTVPLEKELLNLENYLELEKLRLKDPNFISYKTEGDFSGILVPPMLLLTFVENAFKHGRRNVKDPPGIIIHLKVGTTETNFTVINYTHNDGSIEKKTEGIGLQNVTRRLELLYPNCHDLEITHIKNQFKISLTTRCLPQKSEPYEN